MVKDGFSVLSLADFDAVKKMGRQRRRSSEASSMLLRCVESGCRFTCRSPASMLTHKSQAHFQNVTVDDVIGDEVRTRYGEHLHVCPKICWKDPPVCPPDSDRVSADAQGQTGLAAYRIWRVSDVPYSLGRGFRDQDSRYVNRKARWFFMRIDDVFRRDLAEAGVASILEMMHLLLKIGGEFETAIRSELKEPVEMMSVQECALLRDSMMVSFRGFDVLHRALEFRRRERRLNVFPIVPESDLRLQQSIMHRVVGQVMRVEDVTKVPDTCLHPPLSTGRIVHLRPLLELAVGLATKFSTVVCNRENVGSIPLCVTVSADGMRMAGLSQVLVGLTVVEGLDYNPQSVYNVFPLAIQEGVETKELYEAVFRDIQGQISELELCFEFDGIRYDCHFYVATDLHTFWLLCDDVEQRWDLKFCPYCDELSLCRFRGCGVRRAAWRNPLGITDPMRFIFCALHADLRITENLLRQTMLVAMGHAGMCGRFYLLRFLDIQGLSDKIRFVDEFNKVLKAMGIRKFRVALKDDKSDTGGFHNVFQLDGNEAKLLSYDASRKGFPDGVLFLFQVRFRCYVS